MPGQEFYPNGNGEVNEAGLQFYDNLINECLKYGIEPMVTVYHWDMPQALEEQYHGWENRQIVDDYVNYATTLFKRYGDRVKYWITMNEQNIFTSFGWLEGMHPPGKVDDMKMFYQVNHHANMAHAKSVIALKELWPEAKVGASFAYSPSYAIDNKPENAMAKADYDDLKNYYWMDVYAYGRYPRAALAYLEANGVAPVFEEGDNAIMKEAAQLVDFMGVNYYQTTTVEFNDIDGVGTSHEMNMPLSPGRRSHRQGSKGRWALRFRLRPSTACAPAQRFWVRRAPDTGTRPAARARQNCPARRLSGSTLPLPPSVRRGRLLYRLRPPLRRGPPGCGLRAADR